MSPSTNWQSPGLLAALASALLFGVTTPVAKHLVAAVDPWLLAGLLYTGGGLGMAILLLVGSRGVDGRISSVAFALTRADIPWLGGAILFGGIAAPVLLMLGLRRADAASASLLLNLELLFTALIAWLMFREATGGRVVGGLCAVLVGGFLLAWPTGHAGHAGLFSLTAIAGACLGWGLDNNLTRRIATVDARLIAAIKGLAAGLTNIVLALVLGAAAPSAAHTVTALVAGFLGYGLSLVLFIVALRELGTARTSAYFSTAPFIGAAVAILWYGEPGGGLFWLAAAFMAGGIWLHATESHAHEHAHEPMTHTHPHSHDAHHQHAHPPGMDVSEPHVHEHYHVPLRHHHAHFPDIHHRHGH